MKSIHFSIHASQKYLLKPLVCARHLLGAGPGNRPGVCLQFLDVNVKRNKIQDISLRDNGRRRIMEETCLLLHVGGRVGEGVSMASVLQMLC